MAVAKPAPRAALSLLREWEGDRPIPQWQHWVVAVESTGRITLPSGARQVLGSGSCVQAVTREGMLVLHRRDGGASLAIDRRGRLILPAWLRTPARSSGSVLVAARAVGTPAVVVAPTDVLEGIVSPVTEAM
jgi:DNA-binding transcriptional regulator/RsmH inhibitor MraZ